MINTDCVGEIGAEVAPKVSDHRRSKQGGILQLKNGDIIAVKLLSRRIKLNITLTFWILYGQTEREEEYAETRGRSELVATRFCLVNRQIKCYFSQPEPTEKRMEEPILWCKRRRRRVEYSGWLRGHRGRFESVSECKSFPTGAMKFRLMKHVLSLS